MIDHVKTGESWKPKDQDAYYTVVAIATDGSYIGLSGPGPCRGYTEVPVEEFLSGWEPKKEL